MPAVMTLFPFTRIQPQLQNIFQPVLSRIVLSNVGINPRREQKVIHGTRDDGLAARGESSCGVLAAGS